MKNPLSCLLRKSYHFRQLHARKQTVKFVNRRLHQPKIARYSGFVPAFLHFTAAKYAPTVSIQVRTLQAFLIPPCNTVVPVGTKVRITKSEISMRTWRSPMSATSQGAFVVIPEISHSDISMHNKKSVPLSLMECGTDFLCVTLCLIYYLISDLDKCSFSPAKLSMP